MSDKPEDLPQPETSQQPQPQAIPATPFAGQSPFALPLGINPQLSQMPSGMPAVMLQMAMQQSWQAPYPPPEAAERFEKLLPGFFDRVLIMVENGQKENSAAVKIAVQSAANDTRRAHYLGFISNFLAMAGALVCLKLGYPYVAGIFLSVPALAVGKALVDSTKRGGQTALPIPALNIPHAPMPTPPTPSSQSPK